MRILWSNIPAESEQHRTRPRRRGRGARKLLHAGQRTTGRTGCRAAQRGGGRAAHRGPVRPSRRGTCSSKAPVRCSTPSGPGSLFGARGAGAGGAIAMVDINLRISGLAPDELAKMGMAEASGR